MTIATGGVAASSNDMLSGTLMQRPVLATTYDTYEQSHMPKDGIAHMFLKGSLLRTDRVGLVV